MPSTLFLHSEMQEPYTFYEMMRNENPVYWDDTNRLWAIYTYDDCKAILNNPLADIPAGNADNKDGLNEYALLIANQLARLSNGAEHEIARQAAMFLFEKMKTPLAGEIIELLLPPLADNGETDWVNNIAAKLPAMIVLKCFGFNKEDSEFISGKMVQLVKIMLPGKTKAQVSSINNISADIYHITEKHLQASGFYNNIISTLTEKYKLEKSEALSLCVSNLIGLFIQSYDAGRGLLSNSLLQLLNGNSFPAGISMDKEYLKKSVTETLRFDPPVHNTRRIAAADIKLNDTVIKKGETIMLVLAAANRDPTQFANPAMYDIDRINNAEHISFGSGNHECIAKHFSVMLTVDTLYWLFGRYKKIYLLETNINYEPLMNARIPERMLIAFS